MGSNLGGTVVEGCLKGRIGGVGGARRIGIADAVCQYCIIFPYRVQIEFRSRTPLHGVRGGSV